jgi:hypothetical protein
MLCGGGGRLRRGLGRGGWASGRSALSGGLGHGEEGERGLGRGLRGDERMEGGRGGVFVVDGVLRTAGL